MNRSYDEAELSSANAQWRMRVPKAVERELEEWRRRKSWRWRWSKSCHYPVRWREIRYLHKNGIQLIKSDLKMSECLAMSKGKEDK